MTSIPLSQVRRLAIARPADNGMTVAIADTPPCGLVHTVMDSIEGVPLQLKHEGLGLVCFAGWFLVRKEYFWEVGLSAAAA